MKTANIDFFFNELKTSKKALLLTDYDGTLAPFAIQKDKALPYAGVIERIEKLQTKGNTKVVIVTGRSIKNLLEVFHSKPMPEIWGSHGAEKLEGDKIVMFKNPIAMKGIAIAKKAALSNIDPSLCELKPMSIAVHWRGLNVDSQEILKQKALEVWEPLIHRFPVEILPFNGGIELRQQGISKANVVKAILKQNGYTAVAYIGDDFTDEEAFAALGAQGLKILISKEKKESLADFQITTINDLIDFLDEWLLCRQEALSE